MTFDQLMQDGWKPFDPAPKFKRHFQGFIGYISTSGETVLYGPDYARRIGWVSSVTAVVSEPSKEIPKSPNMVVSLISGKRKFRCLACGDIPDKTDRHHLVPRQIYRGTAQAVTLGNKTIRLCKPCHVTVHTLPNAEIATMQKDEQIAYIRSLIVETGEAP